ncbi:MULTISPECIES: GntR family transcriptional regulator [Nocardiaceae]|jgi:DNA-binding GntR family transcriptional regulator|uniref:GntR family transcriptional regulator n=1 Tax=Nocardiaceae TaxID=85025 RepID=UPI0009B8C3C2|nr:MULTISPECIES: GntR family transcriptional regulator [Rhodococcus]OZF00757.1 GntR family transcriptional regulator [Rhodococcus sp. 15-1189-1-1a]OZF21188.1 GntR family transcriptional regulator [Rhodococcus sp. 14-2686-1-2]
MGNPKVLPGPRLQASARATSLTDQVYLHLKEEILLATRAPDTLLIETELAESYGVSKTPIREALRLLVRDGLVTVLPRKGYLVRAVKLGDTREIFSLRSMIEPRLAADATRNAGTRELDGLAQLLDTQRTERNLEESLTAARRFHLEIADMARNRRAELILHGLLDEVRRLHHLMPNIESHIWSDEEIDAHEAILGAMRASDADLAYSLMEKHLDEVHHTMMSSLSAT